MRQYTCVHAWVWAEWCSIGVVLSSATENTTENSVLVSLCATVPRLARAVSKMTSPQSMHVRSCLPWLLMYSCTGPQASFPTCCARTDRSRPADRAEAETDLAAASLSAPQHRQPPPPPPRKPSSQSLTSPSHHLTAARARRQALHSKARCLSSTTRSVSATNMYTTVANSALVSC